jgi:hypothetical protein
MTIEEKEELVQRASMLVYKRGLLIGPFQWRCDVGHDIRIIATGYNTVENRGLDVELTVVRTEPGATIGHTFFKANAIYGVPVKPIRIWNSGKDLLDKYALLMLRQHTVLEDMASL